MEIITSSAFDKSNRKTDVLYGPSSSTSFDNMPQCSFDDIEGADVAYLELVLLAELLPAQSDLAAVPVQETTNLPRLGAIQ